MPNHSSSAIANWFIQRGALDAQRTFTPMQLQKLVYFAHGWNLALSDDETLVREPVEAWAYGPVFPRLYQELARWGAGAVKRPITTIGPTWVPRTVVADLEPNEADVLEGVYETYSEASGVQLSNITHAPDTPWSKVYKDGVKGLKIPNGMIAKYFRDLAKAD